MNVYVVSNTADRTDLYTKAVVIAKTEQDARKIHPENDEDSIFFWDDSNNTWVCEEYSITDDEAWPSPKELEVRLIGVADDSMKEGEVVSLSFLSSNQ